MAIGSQSNHGLDHGTRYGIDLEYMQLTVHRTPYLIISYLINLNNLILIYQRNILLAFEKMCNHMQLWNCEIMSLDLHREGRLIMRVCEERKIYIG